MASLLRLEVFDPAEPEDEAAPVSRDEIDDLRLSAYERGYAAGYEDAQRQAQTERDAHAARIAAGVEALNFGYHEARAHMLDGLVPLLRAMVGALLPGVARAAVLPVVVEQLLPLAASRIDRPLVLRVPAGMEADYRAAFEGLVLPPLTLVESPELGPDQAELVDGTEDSLIDLTAARAAIETAIAAFSHHHEQERRRA